MLAIILKWMLIIIWVLIAIVVFSVCRISGQCSRQEEQEKFRLMDEERNGSQ